MSKEKISWKQKEQIIFICEILLFVIGSVLFLVSRVENLFNLGLVAIMILFCMNYYYILEKNQYILRKIIITYIHNQDGEKSCAVIS